MSIYMLRTREFKNSNKSIYKIGRTDQPVLNRTNTYPKGSELILTCQCPDPKTIEDIIKKNFTQLFKLRKDLGSTETFEGDMITMRNCILEIILNYNSSDGVIPMDLS